MDREEDEHAVATMLSLCHRASADMAIIPLPDTFRI